MASRPIFVATHPRACSTAFERVFLQKRDVLACVHEPFGDAWYFGPERLSGRYGDSEEVRLQSGSSDTTFGMIVDQHMRDGEEKRLFIKDMAYYLFAPDGEATEVAPSLRSGHWASSSNGASHANGTKDPAKAGNPTVLPIEVLQRYHFTFLIRHPRRSVPSFWRCTVPPLEQVTGFSPFSPSEAGYSELRRLFDYLKDANLIGPTRAGKGEPGRADEVAITVVDADDLLDNPDRVIRAFCNEVGVDYSPSMLQWGDEESQTLAKGLFGKWEGFHDDVLESQSLRPRSHHAKNPSVEAEDEEWRQKYGNEAQKTIRQCVDANIGHYEYLKTFAL